jgi:hypothetical protein
MQAEIALVNRVVYFILLTGVEFGNKVPINNTSRSLCGIQNLARGTMPPQLQISHMPGLAHGYIGA